jgi:hypothetical protein
MEPQTSQPTSNGHLPLNVQHILALSLHDHLYLLSVTDWMSIGYPGLATRSCVHTVIQCAQQCKSPRASYRSSHHIVPPHETVSHRKYGTTCCTYNCVSIPIYTSPYIHFYNGCRRTYSCKSQYRRSSCWGRNTPDVPPPTNH